MNTTRKGIDAPRILRYEVPVDGQWHDLLLTGDILHVDARTPHAVEVWAWSRAAEAQPRTFRIYGDGEPIETTGIVSHAGSVICASGWSVRHLIERTGTL